MANFNPTAKLFASLFFDNVFKNRRKEKEIDDQQAADNDQGNSTGTFDYFSNDHAKGNLSKYSEKWSSIISPYHLNTLITYSAGTSKRRGFFRLLRN